MLTVVRCVLVAVLGLIWLGSTPASAQSSLPTFGCTGDIYQVQSGQLRIFDPITSSYTNVGSNQGSYNATGFNISDGYAYASQSNRYILRIGANGDSEIAFDIGFGSFSGDVDFSNGYWIRRNNTRYDRVDLATGAVTIQNFSGPSGGPADVAYDQNGGQEYLIGFTGGGTMFRYNITTGVKENIALPGIPGGAYGASWTDSNGRLFTFNNTTGLLFEVFDYYTNTPTFSQVGVGVPSGNNDGFSCSQAPFPNLPPLAFDDDFTTPVNVPYSGNVIDDNGNGMDNDPDGGPVFAASSPVSGPSNGMVTIDPDGSFVYTPDPNFIGTDTFVYEIVDQAGLIAEATVTITIEGDIGFDIEKTQTGGPSPVTEEGQVLTYEIELNNTGDIPLSNVVVDDTLPNGATGSLPPPVETGASGTPVVDRLDVDETWTYTLSYTVTQADIDAGGPLVNAVSATTDETGATPETSSASTPLTQSPALEIEKRIQAGTPTTFDDTSDTIIFEFEVTNTGNMTTTSPIVVTDSLIPTTVSCAPAGVAPGDSVICQATWTATQTAINDGSFTNSATAEADFGTQTATTPTPGEATAFAIQTPELTIEKAFDGLTNNIFDVGETASFTFTVRNTGNTTITAPITVNDSVLGPITNCGTVPILPGGFTTCTGSHLVTLQDVELGSVTNVATATDGTTTSDPDSQTIPPGADPALTIDKVADVATFTAEGDDIEYTFTVTNSSTGSPRPAIPGPITVTDDQIGTIECLAAGSTLAPDAQVMCSATYTVTQADMDSVAAGTGNPFVTNNAFAGATYSGVDITSPPVQLTVEGVQDAELTTTKGAANLTDPGQPAEDGDTLEFTITVANTGEQTISIVGVTDPMLTGLSCAVPDPTNIVIDPGNSISCTGTYDVTQDDVDAQTIENTATAQGSAPDGSIIDDDGTTTYPVVAPNPSLDVEKDLITSNPAGDYSVAGEMINFQVTVRNDGNVTLNNVEVTDSLVPGTCVIGTLAPGDVDTSCVFTYEIQQSDIDMPPVNNTATATGDPITGGPAIDDTGSEVANGPVRMPELSILKLANESFNAAEGETITYTYTVVNTGNVTLTNVMLDDQHTSASGVTALTISPSSTIATMIPGEVVTLTSTYLVTQDDIDTLDTLTNTVTATGTPPAGTTLDPVEDDETVFLEPGVGEIEVLKTLPSPPAVLEDGTVLTFRVDVANTGNVTLTPPALTDTVTQIGAPMPLPGNPTAVFQSGDLAPLGEFNVGETWVYEVEYTLTQSDVDAGGIENSVEAIADDPAGDPVDDVSDDGSGAGDVDNPTVVSIAPDPSLEVLKSVRAFAPVDEAGETVVFEVTVANTGNVTLSAPVLTEDLRRADNVPVTTQPTPIFESSDLNADSDLDVGETWTYRVEYVLTQEDIDAGGLSNSVVAEATDPNGTPVDDTSDLGGGDGDDPTPLMLVRDPSLETIKTVSGPIPANPQVNDNITFEITVENTGNVTLTAPTLDDTLTPDGLPAVSPAPVPAYDSGDDNTDGDLDVGETWVYLLPYTLTQADIDAGGLSNTVTATADDPAGTTVDDISHDGPGGGSDPAEVVLPQNPMIEAEKTIINSPMVAGDTVIFEIDVTNTGNVTLSGVVIQSDTLEQADGDPLTLTTGPTWLSSDDGSAEGALNAGETATYRATYVLDQDDIDAGGITNSATAAGNPPTGPPVTDVSDDGDDTDGNANDDPTAFVVIPDPSLSLDKRLTAGGPTFSAVDDILEFAFDVENTGNVSIGPITINDPLITGAGGTISCPATILIPGADLTCTASYAVTQDDLDAGTVTNTANATDGTTVSDPDAVTVPALQAPAMEMDKTAISVLVDGTTYPGVPSERFVVGAEVTYNYDVLNTGNVTITAPITVTDNLIAPVTCPALPAGGLAPTETLTCEATYTVTADDVALTSVTNIASASDGTTDAAPVSETIPAGGEPALDLTKELISVTNPGGGTDATLMFDEVGDVLTYQFTVTNDGLLSFAQDVTITDTIIAGPIVCFTSTPANPDLVPGESITCEASYTVDQDDLDAGEVINSAFAEVGFGTDGTATSEPATEETDANATPSITLTKSVETLPITSVDQVLTYTLEATNSGNQTLTFVTVDDPLLPGLTCTAASLDPGDTLTCSDDYTVTQDDVDAGEIVNRADASGVTPDGGSVEDDVTLVTDTPPADPSVEIVKTASVEPFGPAGSTIAYTFAVTNTGNVTLSNLTVTDPITTPPFTCTIASLAPGDTDAICVLSYPVVQDDVDAGSLTNTASVEGTDPFGTPVEDDDSINTVGEVAGPSLIATKTVALTGDGSAGSVLTYTLEVINNGNVTISNLSIDDTMTRANGTAITLDVPFAYTGGDSNSDDRIGLIEVWTYEASYTLTQADIDAGGVRNSAEVMGDAPDGAPVTDVSDDGNDSDGNATDDPTETLIDAEPALRAVKSVVSADSVAGGEVVFEIALTNDGNVTLADPTITDTLTNDAGDDLSAGVSAPTLISTPITSAGILPGESWVYQVTYVLTQADVDSGGLSNSVAAGATDPSGTPVSDISDSGNPADGTGDADPTTVAIEARPSVFVEKTASEPIRLSETRFEVTFTLSAENTGNVTLMEASFVDDLAAYAGAATLESVSTPVATGWTSGGANTGFNGTSNTETLATDTSLAPGETGAVTFTVRIDTTTGLTADQNTATFASTEIPGGATGSASVNPLVSPDIVVAKSVTPSSAVVGDVVTYTISVSNNAAFAESGMTLVDEMPAGLAMVPDSALLNGSVTPAPVVAGRLIRWEGLALAAGESLTATVQARVTEGPGELVNEAYMLGRDGELLSNVATATLWVRPEAVFDCSDILGRVFDDRDFDGYMDGLNGADRDAAITDQTFDVEKFERENPEFERGLPGARLVTVDGTVITTDEYGRFSVPCAALPANIGSNFTLKLDETSLPTGYQVTTENPRTMRVTPGRIARMNFGAALANVVDIGLSAQAFSGTEPSDALRSGLAGLMTQLDDAPVVLRLNYLRRSEDRDLARARLAAVEALIEAIWPRGRSNRPVVDVMMSEVN